MLAGTLKDGDRVDVVATVRYHTGPSRATTRVVLKNLLVLEAPDAGKAKGLRTDEEIPATVVMTDRQAQTMGWAMKMSTWFLALRPTKIPRDSAPSTGDAPLGPRTRAAGRHRGRQDQRRASRRLSMALTDTIRRGCGSS